MMSGAVAEFEDILSPMASFRRDLHANPELGYDEHRTAAKIADALGELGLDVHTGIGGTGVVASLQVGKSGRSIGLRADMDALPKVSVAMPPCPTKHLMPYWRQAISSRNLTAWSLVEFRPCPLRCCQ